ncbi:MAG: L,D-transpeptidase [Micrococcales bacterium]|nr:L,D-transpeptidase [Micrococcales bacterium]MCL2667067.1 L,D-transpeptidase [Micrococcales bacterium]
MRTRILAIVGLAVLLVLPGCSAKPTAEPSTPPPPPPTRTTVPTPTPTPTPPVPPPGPVDLSTLPKADPWAVLPAAPVDPDPSGTPSGEVAYPVDPAGIALYDAPGGEPFAVLPVEAYKGVTGYPVVAHRDDWLQVMIVARRGLPSVVGKEGVNSATGWVYGPQTTTSTLDTVIEANPAAGTVSVVTNGQVTASTQAGFGKAATPTPHERTFVMSIAANPEAQYSRLFVYLAAHSPTLDTFGGGPAPIAIHAYSTYSGQISNGCMRIPANKLDPFAAVPTGTPVVFVS